MAKGKLQGFSQHGLSLSAVRSGDEMVTVCPFCGKEEHFYLNVETFLWSCKSCNLSGNFYTFLGAMAEAYSKRVPVAPLRRLAEWRKLPAEVFKGSVGWTGTAYTFIIRNAKSSVVDVRYALPGKAVISTAGVSLGLYGHEQLSAQDRLTEPVFVTEGEWDCLALRWLLARCSQKGIVVALPGAGTFKTIWSTSFVNRNVYVCLDNDEAGDNGQSLVAERLKGIARDVQFLHWPEKLPKGFDVSDHVAHFLKRLKRGWVALEKLFEKLSKKELYAPSSATEKGGSEKKVKSLSWRAMTAAGVSLIAAYRQWLELSDDHAIRVMFATVLANRLEGDPLWLFLVAPPGGTKTELLMSLSQAPGITTTTSLTPRALVSGASFAQGGDPSMIPKLDGKVLVVKDFTTILSMYHADRDAIFGILRDAYDGVTEKTFGTGVVRKYNSKFGIMAGVTPRIDYFSVMHQSLGERFIKYRDMVGALDDTERIRRALGNIDHEKAMRQGLAEAAALYLTSVIPKPWPVLDPGSIKKLIALSQFSCRLRSVVDRDGYDHVMYRPVVEVGTRLGKQLAKLFVGLAVFRGGKFVPEDYAIVCKTATDTVPDCTQAIVRELWATRAWPAGLTTKEVSERTRLPTATVFRVMQDLEMMRVTDKGGDAQTYRWTLHKDIVKTATLSGVFDMTKDAKEPKGRTVRAITKTPRKRKKRK